MRLSRERLLAAAASTGFRADVLEKVTVLLDLLNGLNRQRLVSSKLALKGGTALNMFFFDTPRLSVDIDLNYVGARDRSTMMAERQPTIDTIKDVSSEMGLTLQNLAPNYAGVIMGFRYASALGRTGNIKVDVNFMYRVPLWPPHRQSSRLLATYQAENALLLDIHEIAAGKLAALFARRASRDLFDTYNLFRNCALDSAKLRLAFVVYGASNIYDWRRVNPGDLGRAAQDIEANLLPLLRPTVVAGIPGPAGWGRAMVSECQAAIDSVLPFTQAEIAFLDSVLDYGEIRPEFLTGDTEMIERISCNPALQWKTLNVRQHKPKTRRVSPDA